MLLHICFLYKHPRVLSFLLKSCALYIKGQEHVQRLLTSETANTIYSHLFLFFIKDGEAEFINLFIAALT